MVSVTAGNDYNKQSQFRKLNSYSRGLAHSKVVRNGHTIHISNSSILVGDILVLSVGDIIPADGLYISGYVKN